MNYSSELWNYGSSPKRLLRPRPQILVLRSMPEHLCYGVARFLRSSLAFTCFWMRAAPRIHMTRVLLFSVSCRLSTSLGDWSSEFSGATPPGGSHGIDVIICHTSQSRPHTDAASGAVHQNPRASRGPPVASLPNSQTGRHSLKSPLRSVGL